MQEQQVKRGRGRPRKAESERVDAVDIHVWLPRLLAQQLEDVIGYGTRRDYIVQAIQEKMERERTQS